MSNVALVVAMLAVAGVLLLGLINMARGGSPETSQKLMRWRVWLQFIAVAIAMLVLFMSSR